MSFIDWIIVVIPLFVVVWIGFKTQKYVKGVSDFLTAGRVAGRYVVAVAGGEAALGLISVVAMIEMYYNCGFGVSFWGRLTMPLGLLFALTGYCTYRFRETRAMTMGQFLEIRYSRSFRILAAVLQSVSGILNYAIFPAVGARFLIYFLDLPLKVNLFGYAFPTFGLVMMAFLTIAVLIVMLGGQVTIMVTDCVQGILSYPMYVVIVAFILWKFSWSTEMAPTLLARPSGESFLNPYDVHKLRDFNLFYVFVGMVSTVLNRMSWSGSQGYNAAAATPHEQKMGGLLGTWRSGFSVMMYILIAIAAYTYLNHANFSAPAGKIYRELAIKTTADITQAEAFDRTGVREAVNSEVKALPADLGKDFRTRSHEAIAKVDKRQAKSFDTIYGQMLVPLAMREMLPVGVTGVFCAIMIFLLISTDTTYLHSWGSIIVQDLVVPLRKKPFTPHQQLTLLRCIIAGVAVFAFIFSFFFAQLDYILMFFAITGAIWIGGAGPVIVFGLYWKRGTTAAAFAALCSGSILAVSGIVGQQMWANTIYPWLVRNEMVESLQVFLGGVTAPLGELVVWNVTPKSFPINSQEIFFISMVVAVSLYVVVSLLTSKKPFNMDRMLHRGIYSDNGREVEKVLWNLRVILTKLIGITPEYSRGDKVLAWSVFGYSFVYFFLGTFVSVVIWNAISPWPNEWWAHYFYITSVLVAGLIGAISTVWFTIGGTVDLMKLFKRLADKEEDVLDDGRVIGHVSASDVARMKASEEKQAHPDA